jgi:hypothetical protein
VPLRDQFEMPSPDKIVTRAIHRAWPMSVMLADIGTAFRVQPLTAGGTATAQADSGRFIVTPGVYLLSAIGEVDPSSLTSPVANVALDEFHAPGTDALAPSVTSLAAPEYPAGADFTITARVVDSTQPDSVKLFLRPVAGPWYRGYGMTPTHGYEYAATVTDTRAAGPYEFVIVSYRGKSHITFPDNLPQQPWDWNYSGRPGWRVDLVDREALTLFDPLTDAARLTFTRIGDGGRRGLFSLERSGWGRGLMRFALPVDRNDWSPDDYTASLEIGARIRARAAALAVPQMLTVQLAGLHPDAILLVTLLEEDGTAWTAAIKATAGLTEQRIALADFSPGRGVSLPQGFPGQWNYWILPPAGRGGSGDRIRPERIARLQLSLRRELAGTFPRGEFGVRIGWIGLSELPPPAR